MITCNPADRGNMPLYQFLYTTVKNDIRAGVLKPGEKLPSKRALADHIGVSVLTVESAYRMLEEEGYVSAKPRSGFYVGSVQQPAPRTERPFSPLPPQEGEKGETVDFRFSVLTRTMRRVITQYDRKLLEKPPELGCPELREAISEYLLRYRGMEAPPERIVIGSGAEYLYGLVVLLLGRERIYGLEDPSYPKIRAVYEANGAVCRMLEMDAGGISTRSLHQTDADVLHVTPFHSYPTGITAPAAKRMEYLQWAREHDGILIEDDFESEFAVGARPVETIFSMDGSDRVIYMNTFSKSLAPSIRMGYMVLPEHLLEEYREKLGFFSCTVPAFDQYVLAEFIAEGHFESHLNRVRRKLRQTNRTKNTEKTEDLK